MKHFIFLILISFSLESLAHLKANSSFLVTHHQGPSWKNGLSYKKQKGMNEHVFYFRKLYQDKKIQFRGSFTSGYESITVFNSSNKNEIKKIIENDPAYKIGTLTYEIKAFTVTMQRTHEH